MNIVKMNPVQSGEVAAFIARLQTDKTHQIAYFGNKVTEIAAVIETFVEAHNVLLAYCDDQLIGVLGADTDITSHRAWLYGPLVDYQEWHMVADALYEEALRLNVIPEFVHDEELFADSTNSNIATFAANHRFTAGTPQASLHLKRAVLAKKVSTIGVVELTEPHYKTFRQLHDMLFPGTYFSGHQIIERLGARDKVFFATMPGLGEMPVGYIYARIEPEATDGYIDFLGVLEPFRRRGIAGKLISGAKNWLFSFPEIEAITLTVDAANTTGLALYESLGFTHFQTLRAYRKRY
ncbi:MAG: GNAT family N-acetyltransferase [Chloroflexota bacterium]